MGSAQKLVPELVLEPEQVLQSAKQPASVPVLVSESAPAPVLARVTCRGRSRSRRHALRDPCARLPRAAIADLARQSIDLLHELRARVDCLRMELEVECSPEDQPEPALIF